MIVNTFLKPEKIFSKILLLIAFLLLSSQDGLLKAYSPWRAYADSLVAINQFDKATDYIEKMIAATGEDDSSGTAIYAYLDLIELHEREKQYKKRFSYAQEALKIVEKHHPFVHRNDVALHLLVNKELGRAYYQQNNLEKSVSHLKEASKFGEKLSAWTYVIDIQVMIARFLMDTGHLIEAEENLEKAHQIANENLEEGHFLFDAIYSLESSLLYKKGDFNASLRSLKKSLKIEVPDHVRIDNYFNIASIYRQKGDLDRSLDYYYQALSLANQSENPDTLLFIDIYTKLGDVNNNKENYDEAIINIDKAKEYLSFLTLSNLEARHISVNNFLAVALMGKSSKQNVISLLQKTLKLHEKSPSARQVTLQNISRAYRLKGDYKNARKYQTQSIEAHRVLYGNKHPEIGKGHRHLGWMDAQEGNWASAIKHYQKALGVMARDYNDENGYSNPPISSVENLTQLYYILQNKGYALKRLGEENKDENLLQASIDTYELTATVVDNMLENYHEGSKQFWVATIRPIYEQALDATTELYQSSRNPDFLEKAFYFAERGRAVLLRESLKESIAKRQGLIDPEAFQLEQKIKIDLAFYRKQIFQEESKKAEADTTKILAWRSNIFALTQKWDSIKAVFNSQNGGINDRLKENEIFSVADAQKNLPDSTLLLEYIFGDSVLHILAIDNQKVWISEIDKDINPELIAFIDGLKNKDDFSNRVNGKEHFEEFLSGAHQLYEFLIAPVFDEFQFQAYRELIIIPDGILGYLPFETLITEEQSWNGKVDYRKVPFLLKSFEIRYEYSSSLLDKMENAGAKKGYVGFAPEYFGSEEASSRNVEYTCEFRDSFQFGNLKNAREEVQNIYQLIRGKIYDGVRATETNFRKIASDAQILHLAMHGFINTCDPLYSGLAFSDKKRNESPKTDSTNKENDNYLYAYEIYNLNLAADMAVLSACNTGSGQSVKGEGIMSLARAFKYAGCPNVVMSLWVADDATTAKVMEEFYQNLKNGMGKADALRKAKLSFINSRSLTHPFLWGSFVLVGDNETVEFNKPLPWLYIGGIGFTLILIAMGIWWIRRK